MKDVVMERNRLGKVLNQYTTMIQTILVYDLPLTPVGTPFESSGS
jgi:hypothetical protein